MGAGLRRRADQRLAGAIALSLGAHALLLPSYPLKRIVSSSVRLVGVEPRGSGG